MNYRIEPLPITKEFGEMWNAAASHILLRLRDGGGRWLRSELPGFREHFSFAYGNQLFFVQILDVYGGEQEWVHLERLTSVADEANGIPCIMPMNESGGKWLPVEPGWGLLDLRSDQPIDPNKVSTDEAIVISEWEVHDIGVQVSRDFLKNDGFKIISWQSNVEINPSIYCEKGGQYYSVIVRTSRKGPDVAVRPENSSELSALYKSHDSKGLFIGLKIVSENDRFDPRLEHLTRRICRRDAIICSDIVVEPLLLN